MKLKLVKNLRYIEFAFWSGLTTFLLAKYFLVTPLNKDFLDKYKYVSSDSYDWIANGIRLFENDNITFRNPALSLMIKLLNGTHSLFLLPLLNQFVFLALIVTIFLTIKKITNRKLYAYLITIIVACNYNLQIFSLYILSDLYAILFIAIAIYFFIGNKYKLAFFALGFSALFQNFSFFLLPVFGLFYLYKNYYTNLKVRKISKKDLTKLFTEGFTLLIYFFNFNVFWFIYKYIKFGSPLYTGVTQFGLLKLHFDSLFFYGVNFIIIFGTAIVLFMILVTVYRKLIFKSLENNLIIFSGLVTVSFWVLFYDWNDNRFLLYTAPFIYVLLGVLIRNIKNLKILVVLALISIYPTFIATKGFFNYNYIPITHDKGIELPIKVVDFSADLVLDPALKDNGNTIWNFTLLGELIDKNDYNIQSKDTRFYDYKNILSSNDIKNNLICEQELSGVDKYIFNSVLLIEENKQLSNLQVINCNDEIKN